MMRRPSIQVHLSDDKPARLSADFLGGSLAGRALAIKDNIAYKVAPTSCSSEILDGM